VRERRREERRRERGETEKMNPIVGDAALLEKYGTSMPRVSETDKIATHLEFALKSLSMSLNQHSTQERLDLLLAVKQYIAAGSFPQHDEELQPGAAVRAPCFIDSSGTPCAVAHLMLATGHRDLALSVNSKHKNSSIAQIAQDPPAEFSAWQQQCGLSLTELQLIQPTYEFVAAECRALFADIMAQLKRAATPQNFLSKLVFRQTKAELSHETVRSLVKAILEYRRQMQGSCGYPFRNNATAKYHKQIAGLEKTLHSKHSTNVVQVQQLLVLLRAASSQHADANAYSLSTVDARPLLSQAEWEAVEAEVASYR
jgi:hypothetical protein